MSFRNRFRNRIKTAIVRWNIDHGKSNMHPEILQPVQVFPDNTGLPVPSRNITKLVQTRRQITEDSRLFI